jgi:hypothetical protein
MNQLSEEEIKYIISLDAYMGNYGVAAVLIG